MAQEKIFGGGWELDPEIRSLVEFKVNEEK
jgi:hypothetical protein